MPRYDDTFVDRFLEPWNRHDVDGALPARSSLEAGQTGERSLIEPGARDGDRHRRIG